MMDEGMPGCMVRWCKSFLEDRLARVRLGQGLSKWRKMQEGLPQGAVSSPALFLIYANEWHDLQEEGVQYSGFADDIGVWSRGKGVEEVRESLTTALENVVVWVDRNKFTLNPISSPNAAFLLASTLK